MYHETEMYGVPPPPPTDLPPPPPIVTAPPPPSGSSPPPPPPIISQRPPEASILRDLPAEDDGPVLVRPKKEKKQKQDWGMPLSVDDLLRKKREADEAAKKVCTTVFPTKHRSVKMSSHSLGTNTNHSLVQPKFLSKAEREAQARKKLEDAQVPSIPTASKHSTNSVTKEQIQPSLIPTGPRAQRNGDHARKGQIRKYENMPPPPPPKAIAFGARDSKEKRQDDLSKAEAKQQDAFKQRYMGVDPNVSKFSANKKRKRTTENKFNFGHNLDEDTTPDYDPIYNKRIEANFFGRGRLAGYDEHALEKNSQSYLASIRERDGAAGEERIQDILEMQRRAKEARGRMAIDVHWTKKELGRMTERDWRIMKEDFNIAIKHGDRIQPLRTWSESGLPQRLLELIDQVGYQEPSPIQRAAIPIALQSRDLIGVAVTGSGKTAAFLLPLFVYLNGLPRRGDYNWRPNDGPYAVVLAPTRELAQQIEIEAMKFAKPLGYNVVSIVGGHAIEGQAYELRDGAEIIIATPGRLVDMLERRILVLSQCCYIIMDEADRMIDLGFEEPVNKILDALPVTNEKPDDESAEDVKAMSMELGGARRYRQTMMYTATMPAAVERIARKYLRRPATVTIGNVGEAVETVEQRVEFQSGEDKKKKRLAEILNSQQFKPPIIVFVNIKRNCDAVAKFIRDNRYTAVTLHGSKTQDQREEALASLRNGKTDVLVATDLAGRGIDIVDVSLVVNFNMATNIESYTHRIGRTGRAGKSGVAITFLGPEDADTFYDLRQMLSKSSISKVPEELKRHEASQQKKGSAMAMASKETKKGESSDRSGGW